MPWQFILVMHRYPHTAARRRSSAVSTTPPDDPAPEDAMPGGADLGLAAADTENAVAVKAITRTGAEMNAVIHPDDWRPPTD